VSTPPGPEVHLAIDWKGDLHFEGGGILLDSQGVAGPNPVQAVGLALAACMAMDVVDILRKGRFPLTGLHVDFRGERAPVEPKRYVSVALHFKVEGDVPPDRVERAIALSRDRYCSVWHTLRQDLPFETSFEVVPQGVARVSGT
jgi:putative redox protein